MVDSFSYAKLNKVMKSLMPLSCTIEKNRNTKQKSYQTMEQETWRYKSIYLTFLYYKLISLSSVADLHAFADIITFIVFNFIIALNTDFSNLTLLIFSYWICLLSFVNLPTVLLLNWPIFARSQIWRVEDHDLYPLEPNLHGVFFSGDSYVIKYSFMANWKRQIIIYFWQVVI